VERAILRKWMQRFPRLPAVGPFAAGFWRSPLRGPWLASLLSAALLPLVATCALTGFLSHLAYQPRLESNAIFGGPGPGNGFDVFGFGWPTSPSWLYAATQGLHVVSGMAAIPILLAKLWTVIPKLFENPPVRSLAHGLERLSLVLLVGGGLFTFATGVINIQLWYPFGFPFAPVDITRDQVGPDWRLRLLAGDERRAVLARPELLRLPQVEATLPIACVEGWGTTQDWQGVRLLDLARMAGVDDPETVEVRSLQPGGPLSRVTLNRDQVHDSHSMLALRVNGADLSLDHGFPARIMVPAIPGVHCTKWVKGLSFA